MSNNSELVYTIKAGCHRYGSRTVLKIDKLTIRRGEILTLVGPSGSGKSTLLRLLAFLEPISEGELHFQARTVAGDWPDKAQKMQVTMVFQQPLLLHRSVTDNVAYGLTLRGYTKAEIAGRVETALQQFGLSSLAAVPAHTLSGGEAQRVALARALVLEPQILLLDEPTANLDPYNIKLIEEMVLQANRERGMTVVFVTHNVFQARRVADRVGLLLDGELVEVSPTADFFGNPQDSRTAAFVDGDMIY